MEDSASVKRAGFDYENVDQVVRHKTQQEMINRHVLSKTVRVVNIPNPCKMSMRELVKMFLEKIVKYDVINDLNPLSWAKPAGTNRLGVAFK
ncbi:hypothetical protein OSTOST_01285, partial [Ostertagia ostertagi]